MALSTLTFTAASGAGPYSILGLDYLSVTDLSVTVNAVSAPATFDTVKGTMTLTSSPAAGATIVVRRITPRRQEQRLTQFLALASGAAGLSASLMDQDYRQLMLAAGEARDAADALTGAVGLKLGADLNWDGQAKKIINLSAGSAPGDAITKAQLDAAAGAARPLPTVSGADNDDGLFVTAGEFDKRTPTQARVHLGLGTAAVLNTGVAANNVALFDSNTPPRYPTADGRNIDFTNHGLQITIATKALATVIKVTRTAIPGNAIDPTVGTWSQNSATRIGFGGTPWTNRIELNNVSDLDGSFTPNSSGRFDLSAGTWRIWWFFKARATSGAGTNLGFRITNNDDTSGQTIHYDMGVHRIIRQFNAGTQAYYALLHDQLVLGNVSPFSLVFRWALPTSGANNDGDLGIYFHKVSTSVIS